MCLLALVVALPVLSSLQEKGILHLIELRRQQAELSEQAFDLLQNNEALRKQIVRLHDDDRYLEELAREKLGLVGQHEVVYRFPAPAEPAGREP